MQALFEPIEVGAAILVEDDAHRADVDTPRRAVHQTGAEVRNHRLSQILQHIRSQRINRHHHAILDGSLVVT
jgi:hypothetical protein